MKKYNKIWYLIIVLFAAIVGVGFTFLGYELFKERKYETTSIENVGQYKGSFYYDIALIPKGTLDKSKVVEYKYKYMASILDDAQYILLTYQYDNADYIREKDRLSHVEDEYASVIYDTSKFDLPAYIYMYNVGDSNEFALVNDEMKQITYICIQCPFDFIGERYVL